MQNLTPKEIVELMDKEVAGQDDAKRMLAIALRNRWRRQQLPPELRQGIKKQNVLLAGPTGTGKTALMRVIRDVLGMPVLEIDITGYSETGYQGKEVSDIPKGLSRLDVKLPQWYLDENKVSRPTEEKKETNGSNYWKHEYLTTDQIVLNGIQVNRVPAEICTYILRAYLLGRVALIGESANILDPGPALETTMDAFREFAANIDMRMDQFDYIQAGMYMMSRNSKAFVGGEDEFAKFYLACVKAAHMRYASPFKESTFIESVSSLFTKAWPELGETGGWQKVVKALGHCTNEQLDNIVDLHLVAASPDVPADMPQGQDAPRIKEIAAIYFMRAVIVGLLKEEKLNLGDFVTARQNKIKIEDKDYGFYFETIVSTRQGEGDYSEAARLAEIGYNIMSAKPGASSYGFKSWRKNVQTLPMNTKKTCAGPNERIRGAWGYFAQFKSADAFTDFALRCMEGLSPVRLSEIFTDNSPLDFKPFRVDVDAILERQRLRDELWNQRGASFDDRFSGFGEQASGGNNNHRFLEQYAVIFIDEIDKVIGEAGRKSDVSREGVQRSLLKVVEGGFFGGFDTTNILFVGAGAFSGKHPSQLMPELLGRFPLRAQLKALTKEALASICAMERSEFMAAVKLVEIEGIKVHFDQDTFDYIAEQVFEINETENTGARRIGGVVEHIFADAYFQPESYLETGYDIRGEKLRALPLMEAVLDARKFKEAKALAMAEIEKAEQAAKNAEPEPEVEQKGN